MTSLRDLLTEIHTKNGHLTPRLVVEAARRPAHPLHDRFEWDDKIAGHKYREVQAAELIRSVKIEWTHGEEDERIRAFHPISRADGTSYEPIETILGDDVARSTLLRQAEREWRAMHRRYQHLDEFMRLVRSDVA